MAKDLERDLGLYAIVTISVGAMIGSGIFVLPGLASKIAGPAVILSYLLAGLTVLPAALSKAEMATALPESGGTYLYIDRAMGPMMGTIAGFGAWFSLVFKSAFALVGLGAYLLLFVPGVPTVWVAIGLALALILVNVFGVKQTGNLQAIIVTGVLSVLALFIFDGITFVRAASFHPGFFAKGPDGVLAAAGFVFVSYAGVTKIASVAEEVEDPSRNLPLGMLFSIGLMMLVYTLIVFVVVGVTDPDTIAKSLTPMADAADAFLGPVFGGWGKTIVAVTAVLALTSMANAGILASSRFPFAMSRDKLAPDGLKEVSPRFRTPIAAIGLTGAVLVVLIAFVPVIELAKLASAFQLLVFSIVNLAVVAFRESGAEWYDPPFESPAYPWMQGVGVLAGLVLITQMGKLPMLGAAGIIVAGLGFYLFYGRERTEREGAGVDALRRRRKEVKVQETEELISSQEEQKLLVLVNPDVTEERERLLIRLARDLAEDGRGSIEVIAFEEVPDQVVLSGATDELTPQEAAFEERTRAIAEDLGADVEVGEVVSHDRERALRNYVEREGVDTLLFDAPRSRIEIQGYPCDVIRVDADTEPEVIDRIDLISDRGPFDPLKVRIANAVAGWSDATIRFLHVVEETASDAHERTIREHHEALGELCDAPTESVVLRTDERRSALMDEVSDASLVIMRGPEGGLFSLDPDAGLVRAIRLDTPTPLLLVSPADHERESLIGRVIHRVLHRPST